jgi:predicted DNA-binding transcriptional regulator AlpA
MQALLTLVETAERLKTPEATLRYWRHKGEGPASFKLGRRVVYAESVVDAWVAAQQQNATSG